MIREISPFSFLSYKFLLEKICRKFRNLKQTADPIITSRLRYITITKQLITLIAMDVLKLKFSSITASSCLNGFLSQKLCIRRKPAAHIIVCLIRNDEPILIVSITFSSMPLMSKLLEFTAR